MEEIYGPTDIEAHQGDDGYYYVLGNAHSQFFLIFRYCSLFPL
jgi:hypothetical protein